MLKAVWSLWTKPFCQGAGIGWLSFKHYLCSWILSVERGRQWFTTTELVTDSAGAALLVEGVGLRFDRVSLALDDLQDKDPEWWVLGKLRAYALQDEPFIHIDNDVFLWKGFPESLLAASVLVQNPETILREGDRWYQPETLELRITQAEGGWLPVEWTWYTRQPGLVQTSYCCGIFGGNAIPFIQHYAKSALAIADHPVNRQACASLANKVRHVVLLEQYFLSACTHYYVSHPNPSFGNISVDCLFASVDDATARAREVGYTHLIGYAKHDPDLMNRLEHRVQREYPTLYEKCLEIAQVSTLVLPVWGAPVIRHDSN